MTGDDPVVERVRAARRVIAEACRNDTHALYEWAKRIESEHADRLRSFQDRKQGGRRA